jgi:MFS family permease
VDYEDISSTYNWITTFELECRSKYYIGLQGTFYFVAVFISSLVFLPLSDYVGRRPLMTISFWGHTIFLVASLFMDGWKHYWFFNWLLAFTGFFAAGYFLMAYFTVLESMPERYVV